MAEESIYKTVGDEIADCKCELRSYSEHSPGLVTDSEKLARFLYSPIHFDADTGDVVPAAFSDIIDKGLSVCRMGHEKTGAHARGELKAQADRAAGKKDREYRGYLEALCEDVRRVRVDARKAHCVIDTALANFTAHSDILHTETGKLSSSKKKEIKERIWRVFGKQLQPAPRRNKGLGDIAAIVLAGLSRAWQSARSFFDDLYR